MDIVFLRQMWFWTMDRKFCRYEYIIKEGEVVKAIGAFGSYRQQAIRLAKEQLNSLYPGINLQNHRLSGNEISYSEMETMMLIYAGSMGWKLSRKHEKTMHEEMQRLLDSFYSHIRIGYAFYVWRGADPGAFLHIYINGISDKRCPGIRFYLDETSQKKVVGDCVRAIFDNIHTEVDKVIQSYLHDPVIKDPHLFFLMQE